MGYCVPIKEIPHLRALKIHPDRLIGFTKDLPTTIKGNRAVEIVSAYLKAGRFPLWLEGEFVTDKEIQITGTDMKVRGQWKIEVKCDFDAGYSDDVPPKGTGNLYLQIAERNPFKYH